MKKDNRLTIIRYICTVLVVILHSANTEVWEEVKGTLNLGYICSKYFQNVISHVCNLAVPTFFFISGYLGLKKFSPEMYWQKVRKGVFSLGVPYIIWSFVSYLFYAFMYNFKPIASYLKGERVLLDIKSIVYGTLTSQYAPLWYLRNLFVFTLLSGVIYFVLKRKYSILIIVSLLVLNFLWEFDYFGLIQWLPIYLIGAYWGVHGRKMECKKKQYLYVHLLTIVISCVIALIIQDYRTMYLYRVVSCVAFPIILGSIIHKDAKVNQSVEISLFIYCIHMPITSTFRKAWLLLLGNNWISASICYFITPVIVISFITCVAKVWSKYLPKTWSLVNGGRATN